MAPPVLMPSYYGDGYALDPAKHQLRLGHIVGTSLGPEQLCLECTLASCTVSLASKALILFICAAS